MHLTVIAKEPRAGHVKTRLCPPCTHDEAAQLAVAGLVATCAAMDRVRLATPDIALRCVLLLDGMVPDVAPAHFDVVPQSPGGLGERLAAAFEQLGPGLIVGMDTPHAVADLAAGVGALAAGDDVIGLTVDGGYWVIGLAEIDRAVFAGIEMSESHTGLAQVRRMHRLGRQVRMLSMTRDVDDFADLEALAAAPGDDDFTVRAREIVDAVRRRRHG